MYASEYCTESKQIDFRERMKLMWQIHTVVLLALNVNSMIEHIMPRTADLVTAIITSLAKKPSQIKRLKDGYVS